MPIPAECRVDLVPILLAIITSREHPYHLVANRRHNTAVTTKCGIRAGDGASIQASQLGHPGEQRAGRHGSDARDAGWWSCALRYPTAGRDAHAKRTKPA